MGKDSDDKKEETGFGFKDKAKAEETIELLKEHEMGYQRLTVRGLLGRAKRVLSLTKAEDKLKNIKEAMDVFEKWLEENGKDSSSKTSKAASDRKKPSSTSKDKNDKEDGSDEEKDKDSKKDEASSDTVPGLGFKDKEKAEETIKLLDGRDPDYQKLAVKGLIGRAKRVLTCTRDKDKIKNIKDAMSTFDNFLDNFEKLNMTKQNMSYLALSMVENCMKLAEKSNVTSGKSKAFLEAYKKVGGEYKKLRTVEDKDSGITWDIIRNKELKDIKKKVGDGWLFDDNNIPNKDHLCMIIWAYSPEDYKLKRVNFKELNDDTKEKKKDEGKSSPEKKRRHSSDEDSDEDTKKKKK